MKHVVIVKPGAKYDSMHTDPGGVILISLRAHAHDGEANKALIIYLAKEFGVPKSTIKILRGINSHTKLIEIPDRDGGLWF